MASPLGSVFLNPIAYSASWHYVTIAGMRSPGAIPINGIRGFERETGWDVKKGKGTQGATLSLIQFPPAEGSIDFQLWTAEHFVEWKAFSFLLKYNTTKKNNSDAFDMYHPSLADLDINSVVTSKISPIRHVGRGLYMVSVDFIEWLPPPPKSVVKTTTKSKPDDKDNTPGAPADPISDANEKQIGILLNQAGLGGAPQK